MTRFFAVILLFMSLPLGAQTADNIPDETSSLKPEKTSFLKKAGKSISRIFEKISEVDTAYIRPQEYNWAAMVQSTTTLESYTLSTKSGHEITFAPKSTTKIGPYGGWRWAFLGYTFDVKALALSDGIDVDFSVYTPIFNVDLMWHENKHNYKISTAELNRDFGSDVFRDIPFNGMETTIKGLSFYFIPKHKRFSYTAAFAQSSCQKRSAGSPVLGIGYTYHRLSLDYDKLCEALDGRLKERSPWTDRSLSVDSTLAFSSIERGSLSLSGGYAYNWVPLRNVLVASSLTAGIAFKKAFGDIDNETFTYRDFTLSNVNFDGCGRFALVYNNMKWFAGASSVIHFYTYNRGQFSTSNWNANINIYAGFNFGRRK